MVKDHSDSERGNLQPLRGLLFPISSKVPFYMHHPTDRIAHITTFVTPVLEHWLEQEIANWVQYERSILQPMASSVNALPRICIYMCVCVYTCLTPNSRSVFHAGVSLNIHSFICVCVCVCVCG